MSRLYVSTKYLKVVRPVLDGLHILIGTESCFSIIYVCGVLYLVFVLSIHMKTHKIPPKMNNNIVKHAGIKCCILSCLKKVT